jgi:hypothetical protein
VTCPLGMSAKSPAYRLERSISFESFLVEGGVPFGSCRTYSGIITHSTCCERGAPGRLRPGASVWRPKGEARARFAFSVVLPATQCFSCGGARHRL